MEKGEKVVTLEILKYIDFDTKGDAFSDFNNYDMEKIIRDYYENDLNFSEIISKYSLSITPSKIREQLPKIITTNICEYCSEMQIKLLPLRTEYHQLLKLNELDLFLEGDSKCSACGHISGSHSCTCSTCNLEKKKLLFTTYNLEKALTITEFGLREHLYLATLLQGFNITKVGQDIPAMSKCSHTYEYSKLFSGHEKNQYPYEQIKHLKNLNILTVSPRSLLEAFVSDEEIKQEGKFSNARFPSVYYPSKVDYSFQNIELNYAFEDEKWLENFKFLQCGQFTDTEVNTLWIELVELELFDLFSERFTEYHFEYVSSFSNNEELENDRKELVRTEIRNLLAIYRPSEVWCILYKGIDTAIKHQKKYGLTHFRDNHVQYVISYGINSYLKRNKEYIVAYDYPWNAELSLIAKLFFSKILKNDNWFNTMIPVSEPDIIETEFFDYFNKLSAQRKSMLLQRLAAIAELED